MTTPTKCFYLIHGPGEEVILHSVTLVEPCSGHYLVKCIRLASRSYHEMRVLNLRPHKFITHKLGRLLL